MARPSVSDRVGKHRAALRAAGLRPIQIWVPDVRCFGISGLCRVQAREVRSVKKYGKTFKMMIALSEIGNGATEGKDIKPLSGRTGYRLRRGNHRAIYQASEEGILVLDIAPRGGTYK
jgi:mRNA-degrading endonuclease RelE of RelBE toxin-antitoxin system